MPNFKQQNASYVSPEEYRDARPWRATSEEICEALREVDMEAHAFGRFTLRLLSANGQDAHDQLVEVVSSDASANQGASGPTVVTVHSLSESDQTFGLHRFTVSEDGIILNENPHTPNFEKGYFVGGPGVGEDELMNYELELRRPKAEAKIKVTALPLPE